MILIHEGIVEKVDKLNRKAFRKQVNFAKMSKFTQ